MAIRTLDKRQNKPVIPEIKEPHGVGLLLSVAVWALLEHCAGTGAKACQSQPAELSSRVCRSAGAGFTGQCADIHC